MPTNRSATTKRASRKADAKLRSGSARDRCIAPVPFAVAVAFAYLDAVDSGSSGKHEAGQDSIRHAQHTARPAGARRSPRTVRGDASVVSPVAPVILVTDGGGERFLSRNLRAWRQSNSDPVSSAISRAGRAARHASGVRPGRAGHGATTRARAACTAGDGDGQPSLSRSQSLDRPPASLFGGVACGAFGGPRDNAVLQFQAVSNRTYTIDFRDTLDSATWTNLYSIAPATNNRTLFFTNNYATPMRVYRIQIPPQQ